MSPAMFAPLYAGLSVGTPGTTAVAADDGRGGSLRGRFRRVLLVACLLLCGCAEKEPAAAPPEPVGRTVLAYMAGDNNLSGYMIENLDMMARGVQAAGACDGRLVAYVDTPGENPRLVEITAAGRRELYRWPGAHDSASPEVMREVVERVRLLAPAAHYGMVLSSHGMAWVPSWVPGYFVPWTRSAGLWPQTKFFGQDETASPTGYLETADLAAGIPDGVFDYLLFDACFMASAEVEYALRGKADWIVAAPTEVIADGFPYAEIVGGLLRTVPDLKGVCEAYYRHYAGHSDARYRSATVSLVRTAELEALATATAALYAAALGRNPEVFSGFDFTAVQRLDRYRRAFLFDLGDVVNHLTRTGAVAQAEADSWWEQLRRTVAYEAHTEAFFDLPLAACCGLSSYVTTASYPDLNDYYKTLDWYGATNTADPK